MQNRSIANLENEALNTLSNYEGYGDEYEGFDGNDGYDGYGDDFMDFDGLQNTFRNEIAANRVFTFTVEQNPTEGHVATTADLLLIGGFKNVDYSKPGGVSNGVLREGNFLALDGVTQLKGTGVQCTLDQFNEFVKRNPLRVLGLKISVTDTTQIDNMILNVEELSPFRSLGTRQIIPSLYVNEQTYRDKIVTVTEGFDYNDQIAIKTTLMATSKLTIQYICGGILNPAAALKNKAARAGRVGAARHPRRMFGKGRNRMIGK